MNSLREENWACSRYLSIVDRNEVGTFISKVWDLLVSSVMTFGRGIYPYKWVVIIGINDT